jgi:hypothetical protein
MGVHDWCAGPVCSDMDWCPSGDKSMIASCACPNDTPNCKSTNKPLASGPRCEMRLRPLSSAGAEPTNQHPIIPHIMIVLGSRAFQPLAHRGLSVARDYLLHATRHLWKVSRSS